MRQKTKQLRPCVIKTNALLLSSPLLSSPLLSSPLLSSLLFSSMMNMLYTPRVFTNNQKPINGSYNGLDSRL